MSGLTGKGSLSIKKQEVAQSRLPAVSFRKVRALHKCSLDQTIINLTSLTSPSASEAKNYSAPNPSLLASINVFELQDNVTVKSSLRGELLQNVSFVVSGASTIELQFEAEENEILEITIDNVARTGATLVDARPIVVTGTLLAGQTDFNVGEPFKVNEFPLAQHGVGLVMIDNQPMYRNTNNQAPGPGVTGDYYEVHAGGGLGTIIRFNTPDLVNDRTVSFISVGALVERPLGSQMALVEAVQGQIDAMIPTLAALAGVDETDFQAQPNNVDLKAFGDRVLSLEQEIETKEDEFDILYQIRTLNSDITATDTNIADLRFINLEIGKTYRLTFKAALAFLGNAASEIHAIHNGNVLIRFDANGTGTTVGEQTPGASVVFQATATSITFTTIGAISADNRVEGDGTLAQTWSMLEELPHHVATVQWT